MKTWENIAERVRKLESLHKQWETDAATPTVEHDRQEVRAVSQKLDTEWSNLHDYVAGGDIEPEAYELVMALDEWIDEVDAFRDAYDANPGGTRELWEAWQTVLLHARSKPRPQMLESISLLARVQKVSPSQIAQIYGWKDAYGQPDINRVLDALQNNDDPPTVSPVYLAKRKKIDDAWERRQNRQRQTATEPVKQTKAVSVAPESIETLLEQNVPSKQIARMKNIDQQTVIDYARELGVIVDGQTPPPALTPDQALSAIREAENERLQEARKLTAEKQKAAETREAEGQINTYADLNNYREQVRQMAFDGCTKQQIIAGLKEQHPDRCKPGSVAQIMSALEREAAANGE
jgi:hypothetical protein